MISIAEAQVYDIASIKHVLAATWRDTYRSFLGDESIEQVAATWHSPKTLQSEIESSTTYTGIATTGQGDVVAMITAHESGRMLFVSRLYVFPSHQRSGIGRRLLDASYAEFPGTTLVRLEVEEQNPRGKTLAG
jgi:ribosomal protein S18 acetylase RimI-like enzyme